MRFTKKKIAGAVAVSAVVALGAGTAFAYWTSTGTGSGTAGVGTDAGVSITSTAVTGLFPGGSQNLTINIQNTDAFPVYLANGITGTAAVTAAPNASATAPCTADDFTVTVPGTAVNVDAAHATAGEAEYTTSTGYSIAMKAKAIGASDQANQNGCKGATVTITWNAI